MHLPPQVKRLLWPIYYPVRAVYGRVFDRPWSKQATLDYWRHPDGRNDPATYIQPVERSRFLAEIVGRHANRDSRILEIGYNVGRNLNFLYQLGFRHLTGLDINASAQALLRQTYPDMAANSTLINSSIEEAVRIFVPGQFELIYTVAALMHVHPESDWIFPFIAQATNVMVTIECKAFTENCCYRRNYRRIFEGLGMPQVERQSCWSVPELGPSYTARVFRKA